MVSMDVWSSTIPVAACAGIGAWGAFHPRSQLFGPTISRLEKLCALTFDDGPNPRVTPQLLALLDKHRVPATFFVLGKYVRSNSGLLADMAARGHAIGNHTYRHPNLVFWRRKDIVEELNRCEDTIVQATGQRSRCVRPPFGFRGPQFQSAVRQAGFGKVVMWSISARDWKPQSWEKVSRRVERAAAGDVILLHDGDHRDASADRSHMLKALEFCLPRWHDSGLVFTHLGYE
jgi:peptidoglycan/xylan/chitin deacetylase (PgdA/CDA1 family)